MFRHLDPPVSLAPTFLITLQWKAQLSAAWEIGEVFERLSPILVELPCGYNQTDERERPRTWELICCSTVDQDNVFIMGYVTFSLGCYMVCCSIASLAVGYIYLSRSQQEPISNRLLIWVVLIYIHWRLTTVPTPSKLNTQWPGVVSFC